MQDIALSCLVVESLLTSNFYGKIVIRYRHLSDFKLYLGSVLLMMQLETYNASVSYDIDGATESFMLLLWIIILDKTLQSLQQKHSN
jgi:hypothetical protein